MKITTDFLRDEVRSGFYIPTAIKQAWVTQLLILTEIDRICQKYNITYFADWGTLLGTVRHGGYIPWDDDLDICMKRKDYIRFRQVADKELPEKFAIHDYERKEDHWLFLSRVVNRNQICFEEEHLNKYYNFPYIATVDIFVLDYLYKDETKEQERCYEVKYLIALAEQIVTGKLEANAKESELRKMEVLYHTKIDRNLDARGMGIRLYQLAEQQMSRVPEEESERIGQIFPWVLKGARGLPKRYYEKTVRLPFEMITMPVPACYHLVLQNRYGDYFKVHKVWDGHDYPYFEGQRKNLQEVADFEFPEFSYKPEMERKSDTELDKSGSLKNISEECVTELYRMFAMVTELIAGEAYEDVLALLPECQQLVVDLGTLVETVKGENNPCSRIVVGRLEQFCEDLFALYEVLTNENGLDSDLISKQIVVLQQTLEKVKQTVFDQVVGKRELLFITTGAEQWKGFESLYRAAIADGTYDVYVVPVPMLLKNSFGQVILTNEEILAAVNEEEYPKDINLTPWSVYSLELHHPDMIFIQDPYDGENPCLTIPPQFYAKNLQKYTEKLVYIPAFVVDEFGETDTTALYNMKHYVTVPGIVYADTVIVQSAYMKQHYIERLTAFAGEKTKDLWEKKVIALGLPIMDAMRQSDVTVVRDAEAQEITGNFSMEETNRKQKRLLFCIGCNEILETESEFMEKLQEKLSVMKQYNEDLQIGICMYPGDLETWNMIAGKITTDRIVRILETCFNDMQCEKCDLRQTNMNTVVNSYDAYYGSATPLMHLFSNEKKPVMLARFDV